MTEGPATPGPPFALPIVLGENAVALGDNLAGRDLRRVRNRRVETLVGDPLGDDHRRLISLLGGLEETERAEDAVAALDQVVAGEARELAELRDERLVDLANDLVDAVSRRHLRNDEWWHACDAPSVSPTGQKRSKWAHCGGQARVTVGEERAKSLGGFNS